MVTNVAVIIVSYNTRDLLRAALESIERTAAQESATLAIETLVVDNGSTDDSAAMVRADFPAVTLIEPGENLGFPRANNLMLERLGVLPSPSEEGRADLTPGPSPKERGAPSSLSKGQGPGVRLNSEPASPQHDSLLEQREKNTDALPSPHPDPFLKEREKNTAAPKYVLLLNPDAALTDGALRTLVDFMEANPRAGICGPSLRYGDGSFQSAAFAFPGMAQALLDLFPLAIIPGGHRLYDGALNGRYSQRLWQGGDPFPVDFVLGAALLIRSETVREVGGMDPGYFMYCEEMDWALRVHQAGWGVWSVPGALIIHHEAQSSRRVRWTAFERLWKSRLRFYGLHKEYFAPGTEEAVTIMVRIAMWWRVWGARRRFALGVISGVEAGEEIAARKRIADIARP